MTGPYRKAISAWAALTVAALVIAAPTVAAENANFAVGMGIDYATGDYDTDSTTDSIRIPLTLDYYPGDRLDFRMVVPLLYQSSSNTVLAGGTRFPSGRHGGMRQADSDTTDSASGLGDISLTTGYLLLQGDEDLPSLRALLYLKFPTADEDQGLGTGEFDIGAGLGAVRWFDLWHTFAEVRYIFQGSGSDLGLKDYATVEAEAGYRLSERFLPTLSLWWSSPPADDSSNLLEARVTGRYWATDKVSFEGYLGRGLSDDSADFLAGLTAYYAF